MYIVVYIYLYVSLYARLQPYQKVNHFLAMSTLSCKRSLGQNLSRIKSVFQEDYGFFPETWELPEECPDPCVNEEPVAIPPRRTDGSFVCALINGRSSFRITHARTLRQFKGNIYKNNNMENTTFIKIY